MVLELATCQQGSVYPPGNASSNKPNISPRLLQKASTVEMRAPRNAGHHVHHSTQSTKQEKTSTLPDYRSQNLKIQSCTSNQNEYIRAIFRSECQKNYLSARIVRRLGLKAHVDHSADTSPVTLRDRTVTPTSGYVDLSSSTRAAGTGHSRLRFYIVKHCPENFDMLIGSDFLTNLSASDKQDSTD